jgi:glycosyltransferase involved in cell wall biosynthesis
MVNSLISVIIPIYNAENYLRKCLDSIVNQSYFNLEIILVDDGSKDSSGRILDDYATKDKRIIAIHKENGGIGSAYRVAFEKATGDYISFVDSDDYVDTKMYEELIRIVNEKSPDIIHFGRVVVNEKGEICMAHNISNVFIEGNDNILNHHFTYIKDPSLACRLFNKKLFSEVKMFDQNIGIDEMTIIQTLSKCDTAYYFTNIFYYTCEREDSVSRIQHSQKKIREGIRVHRFICNYIEENNSKYSPYLYIKYLNYLIDVYDATRLDSKIIGSQEFKDIKTDILKYYVKASKSGEFNNVSNILRIKLKTFVLFRTIYPFVYRIFWIFLVFKNYRSKLIIMI